MHKITLSKINKIFLEWKQNHHNQRLGQYLMNQLIKWESNEEIFYETDHNKAYRKFVDVYGDKN